MSLSEITHPSAGRVVSVQIAPAHRAPMEFLNEAEVRANWGLVGDHHARPDSSRQVLLVEAETLERLGLQPGDVRENLTVQGLDLMALGAGSLRLIGEEDEPEIAQNCAPSQRLEELRPGLIREIAGRRAMLARVVRGGTVKPGDTVTVVRAVAPEQRHLP